MIERNLKYNGTFSSNGILFNETVSLLPILTGSNVEDAFAKEVTENNLMQINAEATRGRAIREIRKRNKFVEPEFWIQFELANDAERRLLFFYLCLKTYRIIFELHRLVTVKRFFIDTVFPDTFYYKMAVDELASHNKTVASWSETTIKKTLSNYRSLLKVSGLLSGETLVRPPVNYSFFDQFSQCGEFWFIEACFQPINN
ncbi:MAG TPA: DUF1819 family protein [Prolixibacteraceae bacterium]|nr:DUF1819 family protein [Prolixibacteraceae bacterium]